MPYSITKQFRFEACHRIPDHKGKCRFLHGHSYRAFVTIESEVLDDQDMVMDFADLDPLKVWIDLNLDHNTILHKSDSALFDLLHEINPDRRPMVCEKVPTAEVIAKMIHEQAVKFLERDYSAEYENGEFRVTQVVVFETETSSATYRPDNR